VHPPLCLLCQLTPTPSLGAFCESPGQPYDGQPCQANSSTCGGTVEDCHGRGPGFTLDAYGFHSNAMIAQIQVDAAKKLMGSSLAPVAGSVRSVHIYLDMANHTFALPNGTTVGTCPAAMGALSLLFCFCTYQNNTHTHFLHTGFSFAGGTTCVAVYRILSAC
jgi:hypothetical protein